MKAQLAYRAKGVVALVGLIVVGTAEYVITDPNTGRVVQQLLPGGVWDQLVPIVLGVVYLWLHDLIPNAPKPGDAGALTVAQADAVKALVQAHLRNLQTMAGTSAQSITTVASPATGLVQLTSPPPPRPQPRAGVGGN